MVKKIAVYLFLYSITVAIIVSVFSVPTSTNEYPVLRFIIILFASILLMKYLFYMIVAPWHGVVSSRKSFPKQTPLVSVIIPAWNEEVGILETVRTVLLSSYKKVEIIIVNDGSTDTSHTLISSFVEEYPLDKGVSNNGIEIKYFYKENGGKGAALNYGIERSCGDIIVTIDADCVLTPKTIEEFVRVFDDQTVDAAVGNVKVGNTSNLIGVVQSLEFLFSFYFKKAESVLGTIYIIGGAAGAFRWSVFEKLGGYDTENITEDIAMSMKVQDAGMKTVYADKAVVYTEGATTLEGLLKQRLRWKQGRFQTFKKYESMFFSLKGRHNKILSWFTLPLALFGEVQIFLEVWFLLFLYVYSWLTNDYTSFISGIVVVLSMFFVVMLEEKENRRISLLLLAPIGWLLFYLSTFVEWRALIGSLVRAGRKQKPTWQKWARQGVGIIIKPN